MDWKHPLVLKWLHLTISGKSIQEQLETNTDYENGNTSSVIIKKIRIVMLPKRQNKASKIVTGNSAVNFLYLERGNLNLRNYFPLAWPMKKSIGGILLIAH